MVAMVLVIVVVKFGSGPGVKWSEIRELGLLVNHIHVLGTTDLGMYKVIFGSFRTLVIFRKYYFEIANPLQLQL